ncbi:hypothetical protein ACFLTP_04400 [Chloroflexota bacterium]
MKWRDLTRDGYGQIQGNLEEILSVLVLETLDQLPTPDYNSMSRLA